MIHLGVILYECIWQKYRTYLSPNILLHKSVRLVCNERRKKHHSDEKKVKYIMCWRAQIACNTDNIFPVRCFLNCCLHCTMYAFNYCEFPLTIQYVLWPCPCALLLLSLLLVAFISFGRGFFCSFQCIQFIFFVNFV